MIFSRLIPRVRLSSLATIVLAFTSITSFSSSVTSIDAAVVGARFPPTGCSTFRFASGVNGVPAFTLPAAQPNSPGDISLNGKTNPIVNMDGSAAKGCNGDYYQYWDESASKWNSFYQGSDNQQRQFQHVFYATAEDQLQISTLQTWQSNVAGLLNHRLGRLGLTCNNGQTGTVEFLVSSVLPMAQQDEDDLKNRGHIDDVKNCPPYLDGSVVDPNSTGGNSGASNEPSQVNTFNWIVDGSTAGKTCATPPANGDVCFYGLDSQFQQTCSTACYWGGLCNKNRCTRQQGDCLVDCPSNYECQYGFCVKENLVASFLQDVSPYLYTTKALIQPASPATQPLYIADGQTVDSSAYSAGVGGSITPYHSAAAAREVGVSLMAALAVFAIGTLYAM